MINKRVVVTGMGVISPIGNNLCDFWNHLKIGYNGINEITLFDTNKFDIKIALLVELKALIQALSLATTF